jgi:arsenate reductase (glutaredoxin)
MSITIYHNPRCSKSRQALALLEARGAEPKVIHYLEHPPSPEELRRLLSQLGVDARALMRRGEPVYKELGLDAITQPGALIDAMHRHPILIERPIVCRDDGDGRVRAVIGRPPERVLEVL